MYIERLSLTNVRTFRQLELELDRGAYLVTGPNASGKSNLVEAISLLATTRTQRGSVDAELISWGAIESDPLPAARLSARVVTAADPVTVDIVVSARELRGGERPATARRFRVNGVARRASDLIGQLRVVGFSADDLRLIDGPPTGRRRYLDLTISQLDPAYVRAGQRYQRVLQQRNSLLRRIQERRAKADDLEFWDSELAAAGAVVAVARAGAIRELGRGAAVHHEQLAPGAEPLEVRYLPRLPEALHPLLEGGADALAAAFEASLRERRDDDVRAGVTRSGPHRDDVAFLVRGRDAGVFASRGQQRSIALALRLAEVELSLGRTGDAPVLLLDDVLSELDAARRERVFATTYAVDQVIITSPDEDRPSAAELPNASRYRIVDGSLELTEPRSAGGPSA